MLRKILAVGCCAMLLAGCARQRAEYPWKETFQGVRTAEPVKTVRVQPANYTLLTEGNILAGYDKLGESRFRGEALDPSELRAGGSLSEFARSIGADTVLLGMNSAGTQMRTRYVRVTSVGAAPRSGNLSGQSGMESDSVAYDHPVEVFDYIAVYLKARQPEER
ncbi:MAG: hypothetical protein KF866_06260 [Phycisphaeraceae bacterium]|nr:hypothetical protein [Phycisphaeraceae bacterium]MCW5754598.1 hypothetical protein [Phycisphaeraceae bacterium]